MQSEDRERRAGPPSRPPVLVPLLDDTPAPTARDLAAALAAARDVPVTFLAAITLPMQTPLDAYEIGESERRAAEREAEAVAHLAPGVDSTVAVARGRRFDRAVADAVERTGAETVVVQLPDGEAHLGTVRGVTPERLARVCDADVVAVGGGPFADVATISVPVGDDPHADLALEVARALTLTTGARVDAFHVVEADADDPTRAAAQQRLADARRRLADLGGLVDLDVRLVKAEADDVREAVVDRVRPTDAVVLGGPSRGRVGRLLDGTAVRAIDREAGGPVVVAYRRPASEGSRGF